jgi:Flp pilus assembly protein TadD/ketosteroid isomerase-like protein
MKLFNSRISLSLQLIAAACLLCSLPALADEYANVSQLARSGKLVEALSRADQYLSTQPRDPQMRFIKGVVQRDSGKTTEAIATFTRLTEDFPELPEPYNNLAVLYAGQSQFDKARGALEMAIRTNPSYATAHENLGDIYAKLASQAYNKALQLDGNNPAVPPKLALIREIFSTAKPQKLAAVVTAAPPTVAPAPAVAAAPAAVAPTTPPKPAPASTATPAAIAAAPASVPPVAKPVTPTDTTAAKEVEASVAAWARAWSAKDVKAYLAAYGKDFTPPGSLGRKAWEEERQQRISSKASISVKVDKLSVSVSGSRAAAKFRQDYKAGGLAVNSSKTLELAKVGEQWLITKETVGN